MSKIIFPKKEIKSIQFGISSPEDIIKQSVCKVDSHKINGPGGVYDPLMGPMEMSETCKSCLKSVADCVGHTGHTELNTFVLHPMFLRYITNFLKCVCIKCYRVVLTQDHFNLDGILKYQGDNRFEKIIEKLDKIDSCFHCQSPKPKIVFKQKTLDIVMKFKHGKNNENKNKEIVMTEYDIKKIFDNIPDDDVRLLGFKPEFMHPKNLVMSVLQILPPRARPYVVSDGNICDDDLTTSIIEIIKANKYLSDPDITETKKDKNIQTLNFRIKTMMNNCLDPNTPILMWDGSIRKAFEIQVGDVIVGDDGERRNVLSICSGESEMYEISQCVGEKYVVNDNHILTLKFCHPRESEQKIIDIGIKKILELPELYRKFFKGLKLNKSINWGGKNVPDDPYEFGSKLDEIDFIPEIYIKNSKNIRLQILAGYIDTKGSSNGKYIYLIGKNIKIFLQLEYIAQTLGFQVIHNFEDSILGVRLTISGTQIKDLPLRSVYVINSDKNIMTTEISVKSVGIGKYSGFEVDGNNRFLLGDFTVTHNSQSKARHSNGRALKGIKERLSGKDGLIRKNLMGRLLPITGKC